MGGVKVPRKAIAAPEKESRHKSMGSTELGPKSILLLRWLPKDLFRSI